MIEIAMYNPAQIYEYLKSKNNFDIHISIIAKTSSTNTELIQYSKSTTSKLPVWNALIANEQSAGRGRQGRTFVTKKNASIIMSIAWICPLALSQLIGWPLVAGIAVKQALSDYQIPITLKWPNDIWLAEKKLGGILIETQKTSQGLCVVSGIGLNLRKIPQQFSYPITSLEEHLDIEQFDVNTFVGKLIHQIYTKAAQFTTLGFTSFLQTWHESDALINKAIYVQENGITLHQGIAKGVNDTGYLLLETPQGIITINTGDVSVRTR